ncbi:MAG: translocation/assembly module TamB domain-containing protein [Chloracidobacterium sp.]|nr:translocation/assembly module TamB domain-containing protein [Chloracidobacterium sp.]
MSDEKVEQIEQPEPQNGGGMPKKRGRLRRIALIAAILAGVLVISGLVAAILFRSGVFDTYVKGQFTAKMNDIGVDFDADVFSVGVSPFELVLKNATFNDRKTGEKLFFIRDARLGLSVTDLFAWQLSRDISIDTTEISGAEVWIRFDEDGRSNFSNLNLVEDEAGSRVNFKYQSVKFTLRDGTVHLVDGSRSIAADANDVVFLLEPVDASVPDDEKRYSFDLTSNSARFVYDGRPVEPIDLKAQGIADRTGAEIHRLSLQSPVARSELNGRITDWAALRYELNIESTIDLTQASTVFPLGTPVRGIGNFKGRVTGEGESYRIDGSVDSESLTAEGIYLRGINVAATVEGTNSKYAANGTAVAQLLTFQDFRVEFPKLAGNVRGTGTDFRWFGELQAVAAGSGSLTLGGLFLSDAVAEYRDRQLAASASSGRARRFSIDDTEFSEVAARGLRYSMPNGDPNLTADSVTAGTLDTNGVELNDMTGRGLKVVNSNGRTDVSLNDVRAGNARVEGAEIAGVTAGDLSLTDRPGSFELTARDLRAAQVSSNGTRIDGLHSPELRLTDSGGETLIYSDDLRVASIDAGSATLGSLNIAGVRLTIREGRVRGTSNDIDAGTITLAKSTGSPEGGNIESVTLASPVFILEPSGRYRASADMSIGGGTIGSVPLGAARAQVEIDNDGADLNDLTADVMDGRLDGRASIAFTNRNRSVVNASFTGLDLSKLVSLQSGRVIPLEGSTDGRLDISFAGTDYRTATGSIDATVTAVAGRQGENRIPVNGRIDLSADNGLFTVEQADLKTDRSELIATGRFDLRNDDSNLQISLRSADAGEIMNIVRLTGAAPEFESQFDSMQAEVAGRLDFNGRVTGNLADPSIDGRAELGSLSMRGRDLGALTSEIALSPDAARFRNGRLRQSDGGLVTFNITVPSTGTDNISVDAELSSVNAGNLLAALPVGLPERLNDFNGKTSGTVNLSGLPDNSTGEISIASEQGTIAGQSFDNLTAKAVFGGTLIKIERGEIRVGDGFASARGTYDTATDRIDLVINGKAVPLPLALAFLPADSGLPAITGTADLDATAVGEFDRPATISINFNGTASDVVINDRPLGRVTFNGVTAGQVLEADLVATLENRPQTIHATLNFGDENLPFRVETSFDQSPLGPFFALIPQLKGISIEGTGTGRVEFGGNIAQKDADGNTIYSAEALIGTARFDQLSLLLENTPINASEPLSIRFDTREIVFDNARFSGGGSNLTVAGSKALQAGRNNNLSIDGRINLALLNVFPQIAGTDNFFGGFANLEMRLVGPNETARLSGTAQLDNASFATFVGSDRLSFDRLQGRILFTSNQVQVEQATGYLGGGRIVANGGALLDDRLQLASFRVDLTGNNITVPLPEDFITTGDARLEVSGRRVGEGLSTLIAGTIRARRSVYTEDIDLSRIVGARREGSLASGASSIRAPRFDLIIEGRDALIVRNNLADLTASVSLRLGGTTENPQISGRVTANSGTVFFRKDRYIVQRAVVEFPPNTEIEPIVNLQAESEIGGYQIFVNLSGPLTDTENLSANVRSSPALPQADVISLITTGSLSNTESGIPTIAQTGINTAAEIITDTIINDPARRATDKLFGLNVFEIDPIISGQRLNPSARLTVGRQINNNLRVTYATNLSQDQNQVVAFEYRVSNRLSFVAQYEQRSLSNVTQDRNSFSIEVRFRKRF